MKRIFSLLLAVSFVLTLLVPFTGVVVHKLASTVFLLLCLVHTVASRKKMGPRRWVLLGNVGRVFSREELLRRVWGITVPVRTRTVDIHIARLRRKLGLREEIRAVMRRGYALRPLPPTQR